MCNEAQRRVKSQLNQSDSTRPEFMFQGTESALLAAIALGLCDPLQLAVRELANRGLNAAGTWVGFPEARRAHGLDRPSKSGSHDAETAATEIARRHLGLQTLEARNSDDADFHELSVWAIREALVAAYRAGANSVVDPIREDDSHAS